MFSENAIEVHDLSKCYQIYDTPRDRLKQFLLPALRRSVGLTEEKYFREFWALRNVNFSIKKGETVGIVGKNGSGKSTLLQIICGTLAATTGRVETNGRIAALLELGAGFNPEFTGRENIYLNGSVLGLSRQEIESRFDEIQSFADIGQFIDQPVKTYSSGMVVRLAFAVAINVDPQILVVDEALSVGDELFQRKCFSRIEAIRAAGATILFVSHSGGTVVELCDRAILLDGGERIAMGMPKKIIGRYQKLLYVPENRRNEIREEIRREDAVGAVEMEKSREAPVVDIDEGKIEPAELPESYDPALKPVSTISYGSYGALIEDPAIYSHGGERVNNLNRGKSYFYRYKVSFSQSASNVRFGMMIKTTNGIELGGGVSAASNRESLAFVEAGSTFNVEFEFSCQLNSGVYFLNAGVVGELNGSETYLHRLVDVAMFRVLSETSNLATGVVDFSCMPNIEFENN